MSEMLRSHRHLALLITAVAGLTLQPLLQAKFVGVLIFEVLAYALLIAVFLAIFERHRDRKIALMIGLPGIAANLFAYFAHGTAQWAALVLFHSLSVIFMGYAVGIILRGVFRSRHIGAEQILGGVCGYLLAGVAWANLYLVIYFFRPDGFNVAPGLAMQLETPESRRFLFNYFSFITLSTVGYGDMSPLSPAACSAAWLEALFGQFYMAVLIGQLIGMKLTQTAITKP
ncbi:MAG: two pore domain potassium channel family protein [Planctomycetales bacterium]|nr:two pore domain potassium channel family protein [Planctomycetales bacterium]MBN8628167.1 two pore domain potassium channel family protein [Planctomycetota bacterium]